MKTRSGASLRKPSKGLSNSLDRPNRPQIKRKRFKTNRMADVLDSSDDSSEENVSFQRRTKHGQRRLSSSSSDSSERSVNYSRMKAKQFKRQRLSSDSSVSSQKLEAPDVKNQKKKRLIHSSESSEENDTTGIATSSSCTSDTRRISKRKKKNLKKKALSRNTSGSSSESAANNISSYSSDKRNAPERKTKKSKRIRFFKNTQNSSEDSQEIDVSGLLKYKLKKLRFAVSYNNTQQVSDIIADKYVKLSSREFGNLLWRALDNKNIKIISLLVRAGVDVNIRGSGDDRDKTLLHVVASKPASKEYDQLALLLIEYGADIEELDGNQNTILHSAVEGGSLTLIEKLLELGVDVNAVNSQGESILYATSKSPVAEKFLPLFVQYKVPDVETKNCRAMEVLRYLIKGNGDTATIKALLELNVPINEKDDSDLTLLDYAISRQKSFEIVKLLLDYGADPSKKQNNMFPLCWASTLKNCTIAALLIKYGASIHDRNESGHSPIHAACNYSSVQCIGLLLFLGAKINIVDYRGQTPFFLMNTSYLSDANKIVIKHFALLASKNIHVNEKDLFQVYKTPSLHKYYEGCLDELNNMMTLTIYNDVSTYFILAQNVQKLTQFIRNNDFVKSYYKNQRNILNKFPIYSSAIQKLFNVALKIRKTMSSIMEALDETTNFVLPEEIWEIIAFYSCCNRLVDFYV